MAPLSAVTIALSLLFVSRHADARVAQVPHSVGADRDATVAAEAAERAKNAAAAADMVAEHSAKIAEHAHKALEHAQDVVREARTEARNISSKQQDSLDKAEASLKAAKNLAERGLAPAAADVAGMATDVGALRLKLEASATAQRDSSMERMARELRGVEQVIQKLGDKERLAKFMDPATHQHLRAEIGHLSGALNRLYAAGNASVAARQRNASVQGSNGGKNLRRGAADAQQTHAKKQLSNLDITSLTRRNSGAPAPSPPAAVARLDVDTDMPYGDIEPFGREDTAQELTEASIHESDQMVDQLERAEVAEEKRAVFRALTRLRGAAIASFDGVARAQTGNIDEYNKVNKWRKAHPLQHLADQESDVSRWAFPGNADF